MSDYDVVIVGSGAGGATMAYALTKRKLRVLLLEAGPRFNPFTDYKLSEENWERTHFPHKKNSEGRYTYAPMQQLDSKYDDLRSWNTVNGRTHSGSHRVAFKYHHVRGVGGSTLAYTGEAHRMHPEAMMMNSNFGFAADWPLSYEELETYYSEAETVIGVAGPKTQGARWRSSPFPLPAHPLSFASKHTQAGAQAMGLTWEANSRAALSKPYDGRPSCNYCANCNRGCPRTDKGSVDVTFLRKAEVSGLLSLRSDISVTRIEAGKNDRVRGVHVVDALGETEYIPTTELILSCGAIETPRLLLASGGVANESGMVGKNFMETVSWSSSALHPEKLGSFRGLPADSICWDYNGPDSIEGVIGGCRFSAGEHEAALNGPLAYAQRVVEGWGSTHKRAMRAAFGRVLTVNSIGESLPNSGSFIDLDPNKEDANGVPLARIHSQLDNMTLKRLSFMAKTSRDILRASGAHDLIEEYGSYDTFSSTHVFGTCRMGTNPETSVVDAYGRSHRWKNLTLLDASVFPSTGGGESPSLTIQALALRASERFAG